MKFFVQLTWVDERLAFQNLNQDAFQNSIPWKTAMKLWKPDLIFANHNERNPDRQTLKYSPSSSLLIIKNGSGSESDLSQIDEASIYNSNETLLSMTTVHYLKFRCNFDLTDFPFDRQTCFIKVRYIIKLDQKFSFLNHLSTCFSYKYQEAKQAR